MILLAFVSSCVSGPEPDSRNDDRYVESARQFVGYLEDGRYAKAEKTFDKTMKSLMPEEKIEETWNSVIAQVGGFIRILDINTSIVDEYYAVTVTSEFDAMNLDIRVVYDARGRVSGLWFAAAKKADEPMNVQMAPPADAGFTEREISVGDGEWILPGTLSVPDGEGPFPAIVLVHGSGPNDRDETVGPNKPFRDLAWGLAGRGIAVLRYDKRTKVHALKMAETVESVTVKEETVDDALEAVLLLESEPLIDPDRIYVLGHSLGGMLIPRIGLRDESISGFVIMAGAARPLQDIILEQYEYIYLIDDNISDEEQKSLDELTTKVALVYSSDLSLSVPGTDLPLGISASYWIDLNSYDPAANAKKLNRPVLVLQGERDYQVTIEDFEIWKEAFSDRSDVLFELYPALNHLFIEGEGKSVPFEYYKEGNVAEYVIDDIARFVFGDVIRQEQ